MLLSLLMVFILTPLVQAPASVPPARTFGDFVTRRGDRLMEGDKEFRFVSFNVPNLHYIEDNLPFEERNPWRIPDEFEIRDALTSVKQAGGRVVRIYTLSVRKAGDDASIPRYVLGPGQFNEEAMRALETVIESGISGALVWSLRFHNRDGGFYWHSEPLGAGLYKAYHWPGFSSGAEYEEAALLSLVREAAYRIRGITPSEIVQPAAPVLLPIRSASAISWQGSAGAASYEIERSKSAEGPWEIVGTGVSDADLQYRPLFSDRYVLPGENWFYRVRARNAAGSSLPSNVAGPVKVESLFLIDEMRDFSNVFAASGDPAVESKKARQAKEDTSRIRAGAGSEIVYRTIRPMRYARVYAFYPRDLVEFEFQVSADGVSWAAVTPVRSDFYHGTGDHDYWKPTLYEVRGFPAGTLYFKIVFKTEAQVGRVEIEHSGGQN